MALTQFDAAHVVLVANPATKGSTQRAKRSQRQPDTKRAEEYFTHA